MKNFKSVCHALLLFAAVLGTYTLSAQTGKPKTTPVKSVPAGSAKKFDPAKLTRADIDSLRQTGQSNAEIAALIKGKKTTKEMLLILKKTPPQTAVSGKSTPVRTSGSGSTAPPPPPPPPPPFTAEDEADAAEMAQILLDGGVGRQILHNEGISALWEVYNIPDLATLLRILDTGGLMDERKIIYYAANIANWLSPSGSSGQARAPYPAPTGWLSQYPAFYDLYLSYGVPAGQVLHEWLTGYSESSTRAGLFGRVSPPNAFFTVSGDARKTLLFNEISAKYGYTEQAMLRSVMEFQKDFANQSVSSFISNENQTTRRTAEYWAAVLKLDNVIRGSDLTYASYPPERATSILSMAGYTTVQVTTAIRAVYQ